MSTQRNLRKEIREQQNTPINVTVIVDGITKVIPYAQYKEEYLDTQETPEEIPEEEI